jgi:uncharacterized RDD family membrane protein YckC
VSVIGIAVVPFVICALFIAAIIGKVGVARWIGATVLRQSETDSRLYAVIAFAIGFAIITIGYMVPVLGFVAWTMLWVLGMGASALAFIAAYRRENPLPVKAVRPAAPPPEPGPSGPADDVAIAPATPEASGSAAFRMADAGPVAADPVLPPFSPGPASQPGAAASSLLAYPFAAFADRAAAFVLDVILVLIVRQILDLPRNDDGAGVTFLLLLMYHIGFWGWKGTTVGGIICQLRIVRLDGSPLRFVDALVRGLASIFSLAVLGIGALWILRDPERQSWHDKIAGTYVVKVPRNYPI